MIYFISFSLVNTLVCRSLLSFFRWLIFIGYEVEEKLGLIEHFFPVLHGFSSITVCWLLLTNAGRGQLFLINY